jgi:DEAD/DEAH box helicase domain-containing protein
MRNIAQLLLMCDRHDIGLSVDGGTLDRSTRVGARGPSEARSRRASALGGGAPSALSNATAGVPAALAADPSIFIYDNYPGGIGFSRPLYEMHALLLERTRDLIVGCPCESGCPSCVGPEGNTGPHAKAVAMRILDDVLLLLPGVALPDLDPGPMQFEKDRF